MANGGAIEAVNKGETILILVLVGVGAYLVYNAWGDISSWIDKLTGADQNPDNTYLNAASQTLQHPITTMGSILGFGMGSSGGQSELPSDISSVGYVKVGASGTHWSCTGPQGAANDSCEPYDPSTNKVTGPGVPAGQAN